MTGVHQSGGKFVLCGRAIKRVEREGLKVWCSGKGAVNFFLLSHVFLEGRQWNWERGWRREILLLVLFSGDCISKCPIRISTWLVHWLLKLRCPNISWPCPPPLPHRHHHESWSFPLCPSSVKDARIYLPAPGRNLGVILHSFLFFTSHIQSISETIYSSFSILLESILSFSHLPSPRPSHSLGDLESLHGWSPLPQLSHPLSMLKPGDTFFH